MAMTRLQFCFLLTGCVIGGVFITGLSKIIYDLVTSTGFYEDANGAGDYVLATLWLILSGLALLIVLSLALVCLHISSLRASKYHTVTSLLFSYIMYYVLDLVSGKCVKSYNKQAQNPRDTQEIVLKERMEQNANTVYGKEYEFATINCIDDLRNKHPLTTYAHYEDYVQRMANGEENVLIAEELERFGITSGTTGKGKLIPLPKSRSRKYAPKLQGVLLGITMKKLGPMMSPLQREIITYVNPEPTKTASGKDVGPMLLFTDDMKWILSSLLIVPYAVLSITTEHEAQYLTLLFALRDADIGVWTGPFSSQVHKAMSRLETHWKQIVHDIKTGTIDKDLEISAEVRDECMKEWSPEPERAKELETEFEKGFVGIIRRVWPHISYILCINTADYTEKLRQGYAKGVPVVSFFYSSTEGDYGLNLWPDKVYSSTEGDYGSNLWPDKDDKYALNPDTNIYEFIPEENINEDQPSTLLIDEVKKGEVYELVISSLCGFYRYRFGDVIKVVDYYYNLPVFKFMYRSGQLLNLRGEKVTEISVDVAVRHVIDNHMQGAKLVDWTSAESTLLAETKDNGTDDKGSQFYLIFVELEGDPNSQQLDEAEYQRQFDTSLQELNNYYKGYRNAGTISPPQLYLVRSGTFNRLQDFIVANSTASYNQFKVPRKLKTQQTLELMMESRNQTGEKLKSPPTLEL